ncbi:MAG: aminoacetone oxidase family FAD-binding enzyme, partial [bacterium]|nr:aminoacetone oxidase family FAD-binding enzyme [bacterium]
MKKIVVIGAGAAGLVAAAEASKRGLEVIILEHMPRPARKILVTGKGRCNVTNNCNIEEFISQMTKNGRFMYSAFSNFTAQDTISFFEGCGVQLKTERGNRVFPKSDRAMDIADALVKNAKKSGAVFKTGKAEKILVEDSAVKGVLLCDGTRIECDGAVLATGGCSYPATGSDGSGYKIAREAGHNIIKPIASLIPVVAREGWCEQLQGLSLRNVALNVYQSQTGKKVFSGFGEMMFTHFGMTGPLVLSASAHTRDLPDVPYNFEIDLKPALTHEQLDARILKDFSLYSGRDFCNCLGDLLPKSLIPVIVGLSGIPKNTKANQITKKQREGLTALIKRLCLEAIDLRPIEEAIVTSGGIDVGQINPKTMES